jgi:hypothetical protein
VAGNWLQRHRRKTLCFNGDGYSRTDGQKAAAEHQRPATGLQLNVAAISKSYKTLSSIITQQVYETRLQRFWASPEVLKFTNQPRGPDLLSRVSKK